MKRVSARPEDIEDLKVLARLKQRERQRKRTTKGASKKSEHIVRVKKEE
jgi:hypothetical protein